LSAWAASSWNFFSVAGDSGSLIRYTRGMKPVNEPAPDSTRAIDVTGLPEEAIRAVELLVSHLKEQAAAEPTAAFSSYEEWAKAFRQWVESHKPQGTSADWNRESIYAGRGE
jgi:hypothetical protein